MKKYCIDLKVNSVERLSEKHVLLRLSSPDGLPEMLPGQFVEVRVDDSPSTFLRRPISINNVDEEAGELWLLVATIGDGTRRLGRLCAGDTLNCLLELEMFRAAGRVLVTTEDGSLGEQGFVTNHSALQSEHFDFISTCGPKPMMVSVARYAKSRGIECEVSLENLMACGLGACLCCVENTVEGNVCVCKEGPVLNIRKLKWQF